MMAYPPTTETFRAVYGDPANMPIWVNIPGTDMCRMTTIHEYWEDVYAAEGDVWVEVFREDPDGLRHS